MDAFSDQPSLQANIQQAAATFPALTPLFTSIDGYVSQLKQETHSLKHRLATLESSASQDPASKKRKIGGDAPVALLNQSATNAAWRTAKPDCAVGDVSVSVPIRKKVRLELVKGAHGGLRGINQSTGDLELGVGWDEIEQLIVVPVPEKSQPQWNFIAVRYSSHPASGAAEEPEPVVWTISNSTLRTSSLEIADGRNPDPESRLVDFLERTLNAYLAPLGKRIMKPNAAEFTSALVQAHRKDEKAFHVKAFRGSKDGFLFLLPAGIIFGFRKPILFFPFSCINSVSYSSVLQRTFNLTISATPLDTRRGADTNGAADQQTQDFEFSMLDQADYQGIDDYVKRHGLNNASLADSRRAQYYNVNKVKGEEEQAVNGQVANGSAEEPESELAKAEQALQDAEDEEEEDYDPGSGGESDGSGSDSEEEGAETYEEVGEDDEEEEEEEAEE